MPSSTDATNLFLLFTARLDAAGLAYMVTGSVAGTLYGEPRLTHDVDLVVEITSDAQVDKLCLQFPDEDFYCAPAEVIKVEYRRRQRGHFNIIHHDTGFKGDVYLLGADPLHRWAMDRRQRVEVGGRPLTLAPPEYVIVRKLEFYREGGSEKHLSDIKGMLLVSGDEIDREVIETWTARLGLNAQWSLIDVAAKADD